MAKEKLNIVIMGQNCEKFIKMCLNSVKDADSIIYCDGGSNDSTYYKIHDIEIETDANIIKIENPFNQEDKGMNGKQRNFYLDYLKKHHMGEWCLCLDADEVVDTDGIKKLKEFINILPKQNHDMLFSPKMRHFIGDLGHEDATQQTHFVPHRLFKVRDNLKYQEVEHTVLECPDMRSQNLLLTTIWHLSYVTGMFDIKKKYNNHLKKSNMHTPEYLKNWRNAHLFGMYPTTKINPLDISEIILKEFGVDKDELYFTNRANLEAKHFILSKQWIDHFKPKKVLDLGCGIGLYGYAFDTYKVDYQGLEVSKWATENTAYKHLKIKQGDIRDPHNFKDFDLVLAVDVLEHLEEKDLDQVLGNIKTYGNNFLFSIPYLGDPNLDADPTHKIKKPKDWWINKLTNHFKIKEAPDYFAFHEQMLIGELK